MSDDKKLLESFIAKQKNPRDWQIVERPIEGARL
jgi:hypothetical protein